jgi:hypothetical protein
MVIKLSELRRLIKRSINEITGRNPKETAAIQRVFSTLNKANQTNDESETGFPSQEDFKTVSDALDDMAENMPTPEEEDAMDAARGAVNTLSDRDINFTLKKRK